MAGTSDKEYLHSRGSVFRFSRASIGRISLLPDIDAFQRDYDDSDPTIPGPGRGLAMLEQTVHALPVFQECSYDFVEAVLAKMRKLLCKPGQVIIQEGSSLPQSMFLILWGSVNFLYMNEVCGMLTEGQTFGEAQLLGIFDRWSNTVTATGSCMVCELRASDLKDVLHDYPAESEYFGSIFDYYAVRSEEWSRTDTKQSLRRVVCLRDVSDPCLQALQAGMERRLIFPGQDLFNEKSEDDSLYMVHDGEVVLEIAGRIFATKEVPALKTSFTTNETIPAAERPNLDNSNAQGTALPVPGLSRVASVEKEKESEQGGPADDDLPEAAIFGEEVLLGISHAHTYSVSARKICDVCILHRQTFHAVLQRFPADKELIQRYLSVHDEVFPPLNCEDTPFFKDHPCTKEFYAFINDHIEERLIGPGVEMKIDNLDTNIQRPLLQPFGNLSYLRINKGSVTAFQAETASRPAVSRTLGPGSFIEGSRMWAGEQFTTDEACYVSIIHRGVIARALEEYPADREQLIPALIKEHHQQQHSSSKSGSAKVRSHKQERVAKILRDRSIFSNTSQEFLAEILEFGVIRVFMAGDRIIEQGADGTSMFILSVGTANVVKEQIEDVAGQIVRTFTNIGGLTYGSVFGELVMLGVQSKRSASIVAGSICCTWEVEHQKILSILNRHPTERANFMKLVEEHLDKLAAPRVIYHELFNPFNQQFRTLIGVNCERKLHFPGEVIVRENTTGDRMYIINLGSATVEVAGQHVMQIKGGSHFGFQMIASGYEKERYCTTVTAETLCQVLIITRTAYLHALEKYPQMQVVAKSLEASERARTKKQLIGFQQLVQRRQGLRSIIEALREGCCRDNNTQVNSTNRPMLEAIFNAWRVLMTRASCLRREQEELRVFNATQIERWLSKRKQLMEHVKPRIEMEKLVKRNLHGRGPLKLVKDQLKLQSTMQQRSQDDFEIASRNTSQEVNASPYMAPSVIWRRMPNSARVTRQLPPLPEAPMPPMVPMPVWCQKKAEDVSLY
jgi:CRP-like cAMP-binding protein